MDTSVVNLREINGELANCGFLCSLGVLELVWSVGR